MSIQIVIRMIYLVQNGVITIDSFAALCTALASTIGTGNIVGIATAMATKYAEGVLQEMI